MKGLLQIRTKIFLPFLVIITTLAGCSIPETDPVSRLELAQDGVYAADIHVPTGMAVYSEVSGEIIVFDLNANKQVYSWRHQGEGINLVDNVQFANDGNFVVTSDSEAFALWSMQTGEPVGFWKIDESTIRDIAVANQGRGILVGRSDGIVMYFEPSTQRRIDFIAHEEKINSVDISSNGRFALSGSNDYKAYLWDTQSGQIIHVFDHPHRVTTVLIDQNAEYLFTADGQDKAQIWNAQTGQEVSRLHFVERQLIFTAAKFSPDGKYLLTGSPAKRLALWDVLSGRLVAQWRVKPNKGPAPQSAVVYAVDFSDSLPVSISSNGYYSAWPMGNKE